MPPTRAIIRPYQPTDREAVRHICCETGFSGDPVDPVFSDRDVFADFFTRYYTDHEPEHALVAEDEGRVVGYLLGCCRPKYHDRVQLRILALTVAPKVVLRFLSGRYSKADRAFLYWCCFKGSGETPNAPKHAGHLHFNLLPEYRNTMLGKKLYWEFCEIAKTTGVPGVYGQIQTGEDRRPIKVFERYGMKFYDQKQITKFQGHHNRIVYVTTVYRDFSDD